MISVVLIRHGLTSWNQERRIQGQTDVGLSPAGRAQVAGWSLPPELEPSGWYSSPLRRTLDTARLLGAGEVRPDPRLAEMNWGRWEGRTVAELRRAYGAAMAENERRGLDFRPPGGESPREVRARLAAWLNGLARTPRPIVAVTHKGIIRAALSLACDWDLQDTPPWQLDRDCAHVFRRSADGQLRLERPNVPLQRP